MKTVKPRERKNSFGLMAKDYQKYRRTYDAKLYKLLFALLDESSVGATGKDLTILDIGCGTGKSTEPVLASAGKRPINVFGVDPDEMMLDQAIRSARKKKLPITYLQGTAEKLSFGENTFDAAISGAAFHWFGNKTAMNKVKEILKPGGLFFVFWAQHIDNGKPAIGAEIYGKYDWQGIPQRFRGQKFVADLLTESGFRKVATTTIPFSEMMTREHAIGLITTNSSYALFSPADKKSFIKEMTKAHKEAMGKEKYLRNDLELRICYGFK